MENWSERVEALEATLNGLQTRQRAVEARLQWWRAGACVLAAVALVILPLRAGRAQSSTQATPSVADLEAQVNYLAEQLTKLQTDQIAPLTQKLKSFAAVDRADGGQDVYLDKANLHIRNGVGFTEVVHGIGAGLGNLIIGYNEARNDGTDDQSGSHSLVIGTENSFSGYGGIVVGEHNTIKGHYACVTGGFNNSAVSDHASVSGGRHNVASADSASVSGGDSGGASGVAASVSGGGGGVASGIYASVSGGDTGRASADFSSVTGGQSNVVSSSHASITGGIENEIAGVTANFGSISGGHRVHLGPGALAGIWVAGNVLMPQ